MSTMTEMRIEELLTKSLPQLAANQAKLVNNTAEIMKCLKEILKVLNRASTCKK